MLVYLIKLCEESLSTLQNPLDIINISVLLLPYVLKVLIPIKVGIILVLINNIGLDWSRFINI